MKPKQRAMNTADTNSPREEKPSINPLSNIRPILNNSGKSAQSMNSLEISELTSKRHDNVVRDIESMLNELEIDALRFEETYTDSYDRHQKCYNLSKDLTLTLVSGYNAKMRFAIIQRWQELETTPLVIPQSFSEALSLAADLQANNEQQTLFIEQKKPLYQLGEQIQASEGAINVGQFANALSNEQFTIGQNRLFTLLRELKFLKTGRGVKNTGHNLPYQKYINMKTFEVIERTRLSDSALSGRTPCFTTMITGKGQVYLANKLRPYLKRSESNE